MNYTIITIIESIYLFYMYFIFTTKFSLSFDFQDKTARKLGPFFAHKTDCNCNKVCDFGRFMAIVSIVLGFVRLNYLDKPYIIFYIFGYGILCLIIAFIMNMNAFIYLLPLVVTELIIILSLYNKKKHNKSRIYII